MAIESIQVIQVGKQGPGGPPGPASEGLNPDQQAALDANPNISATNAVADMETVASKAPALTADENYVTDSEKEVLAAGVTPIDLHTDTKDPTGFISPESVVVTGGALNVTLTGELGYYFRGIKNTLVAPFTPANAHPDEEGPHYLYSTDGETFSWGSVAWAFDTLHVARHIKVGSVHYYFREPHGCMPWQAHHQMHHSPYGGSYRKSGGSIVDGSFALNTPGDAAVTPDFSEALILDEDLPTTVASVTAGEYCQTFFSSNRVLNFTTAQAFPYRVGTTYPLINTVVDGVFSDVETLANKFFNVYQILSPVAADSDSQSIRMQFLQPQTTFASPSAAQAENPFLLDTTGFGGFGLEQVLLTRLTYATNASYTATGKVRLVDVKEVTSKLNISGVSSAATTAENVTATPHDDIASTNVQGQLEEIAGKATILEDVKSQKIGFYSPNAIPLTIVGNVVRIGSLGYSNEDFLRIYTRTGPNLLEGTKNYDTQSFSGAAAGYYLVKLVYVNSQFTLLYSAFNGTYSLNEDLIVAKVYWDGGELTELVDLRSSYLKNIPAYSDVLNLGITKEPIQTEATQVEAEAGTEEAIRSWSVVRIWLAIAAKLTTWKTILGQYTTTVHLTASATPATVDLDYSAANEFIINRLTNNPASFTITESNRPTGTGKKGYCLVTIECGTEIAMSLPEGYPAVVLVASKTNQFSLKSHYNHRTSTMVYQSKHLGSW